MNPGCCRFSPISHIDLRFPHNRIIAAFGCNGMSDFWPKIAIEGNKWPEIAERFVSNNWPKIAAELEGNKWPKKEGVFATNGQESGETPCKYKLAGAQNGRWRPVIAEVTLTLNCKFADNL